MSDKIKSLLESRRFWAAVGAIAVPILNDKFQWGLSPETFITTALVVVGWILGESKRSSQGAPNVPVA